MSRMCFIAIVVFGAQCPITYAQAEKTGDKPLFTAGFMSDTHVKPAPGSCDRVRAAYEFFKAKGISLIANLGDIAERHYPDAYRAYRRARRQTAEILPYNRRWAQTYRRI